MSASQTRDWDATAYHRVGQPQFEWGLEVLRQVELHGDETVLDAGCGSGRLTEALLERLPRGRVVAVDGSLSMVEAARKLLSADRATVIQSDLVELELDEPVDVVFSAATFHWIPDHDRLFARLLAALRPGGRLRAQCGGEGNTARFRESILSVAAEEPFDHYFDGWKGPWNFAAPDVTEERLRQAGFEDVRCWLEPRPVHPPEPRVFIDVVCLGHHLERLPEELRRPFGDRIFARAGGEALEIDYVRLNMQARRPG